ncbi:MAG: hypothetical protein V3U87_03175 [Methylococcaceae bacterium]
MSLKKSHLKFIISIIIVFFTVYNITFTKLASLPTARIAFFVVIILEFPAILLFLKNHFRNSTSKLYYTALLFVFIYSATQYIASPVDNTQFSRVLFFILFSFVSAIGLASLLNFKIDRVAKVIAIAIFIQSLFIFIDYNSADFHSFVSNQLVQSERYREDWIRAVGLTNGGGSSLSLVQFSGFVVSLYVINKSSNIVTTYVFSLMAISIFFSTLLTGRTGVVLEIIFIILYPLTQKITTLRVIKTYIIVLISIGIVFFIFNNYILEMMLNSNSKFEFLLLWLEEILELDKGGTVNTLQSMTIPPLSMETIFGTGLVSNPDGSNASGSDIGYIQTYYALGLIFSIIFYSSLLLYSTVSFKKYFKSDYKFWILFTLLIFVAEFKEPYIFKYSLTFVLFSILSCRYYIIANNQLFER